VEGKSRTLTLADGRKTSLKFDEPTWEAIDLLARHHGTRWTHWARQQLADHPEADNLRAVLRAAVTRWLLDTSVVTTMEGRADALARPTPALLAAAYSLDDGQLAEEQAAGTVHGELDDLGGFHVVAGEDQQGRACYWIKNGLRAMPNVVLSLPFSVAEVEAKARELS
jgi:predicted DNA-binding ribbon-helix-helix protein